MMPEPHQGNEARVSESPALSEPGSLVMDTDQPQQEQQSIFTVGPSMDQEERLDLCQTILDTSIHFHCWTKHGPGGETGPVPNHPGHINPFSLLDQAWTRRRDWTCAKPSW